jgi:hypothetical protein
VGVKFTNNAKTTLTASLSNSATSASVTSSSGFPSLSGSDYFYATLAEVLDDTTLEIVKVTAVSGTTWTISRAQDNTTARSYSSGDKIELRASAGLFTDLLNEKATVANPTFTGNITIGSAAISETELEILDGATVTTDELNKLDGTTATPASLTYGKDLYDSDVTAAEFDYLDGVTSNIQTQISTKITSPSGFARGSVVVGNSSGAPANLGVGADGYVLKSDGTDVAWAEDEKTTTTNFVKNAFTGDNTTTAFTLSQSPNSEDNLIVFIEGIFQNQGDYALSGTTLTLDEAPATGRKIVVYHVKAAVSGANLNHDQFTASGSAAFTLSITPINENNTQVFIDGVYQQKTDYSVSGTTLTFDTAPTSSAIVEVMTFTQTEINVPTTGSVVSASIASDVALAGNPTTSTQSAGNTTTRIATTAFVETAVSNLIASAPGTMDTLNEIAAALNDDPAFTTTVNNAIATKMPLAGGTMSGAIVMGTSKITGLGDPTANQDAATKTYVDTQRDTRLPLAGGTMTGAITGNLTGNVTGNVSGTALTVTQAAQTAITSVGTLTGLAVAVGSDSDSVATITSSASGNNTQLRLGTSGNNSVISGTGGSTGGLVLKTYGTAAITVDASQNTILAGTLGVTGVSTLTGNVGIGGSPSFLLDVTKSNVGGVTDMRVFNAGTTNAATGTRGIIAVANASVGDPRLVLAITGIADYHFGIDNSDSDKLKIGSGSDPSAGTNYLTIDAGKVGIGVTSPSSWYADNLVVSAPSEGGITIASTNTSNGNYLAFADGTSGDAAYRGIVGYNHASDYMFMSTAGGERMRIDSSGNVGISNTSPEAQLHIKSASNGTVGDAVVIIEADQDNNVETDNPRLEFWQDSRLVKMRLGFDDNDFQMVNEYSGGQIELGTANAIRMTIDASGNVLVGTTSTSLYNDTSGGGINLSANGGVTFAKQATSATDPVLLLNNTGTEGQIVDLRQDGTTVGSLSSYAGAYLAVRSQGGNLRLGANNTDYWSIDEYRIYPTTDAVDDIGLASNRVKDLYLSGVANIGSVLQTVSSTGLAGSFANTHASGYGLRVTTYGTGAQYGFAVDSYGGGYSRDFTVGADGNVNVLTGNLVIGTAGKGISFAATSDGGVSTPSELLDDYEEGTWTPTIVAYSGTNPSVSMTAAGTYVKIGKEVSLYISLAAIAVTGTKTGLSQIGGLPFGNVTAGIGSLAHSGVTFARTDTVAPHALGNSHIGFLSSTNGSAWAWEANTIFPTSAGEIRMHYTYLTS